MVPARMPPPRRKLAAQDESEHRTQRVDSTDPFLHVHGRIGRRSSSGRDRHRSVLAAQFVTHCLGHCNLRVHIRRSVESRRRTLGPTSRTAVIGEGPSVADRCLTFLGLTRLRCCSASPRRVPRGYHHRSRGPALRSGRPSCAHEVHLRHVQRHLGIPAP